MTPAGDNLQGKPIHRGRQSMANQRQDSRSIEDLRSVEACLGRGTSSTPALSEMNRPEDHKFWNTQPVTKPKWSGPLQAGNRITADDGAILSDAACRESTSLEPEPLLDRFQWSIIDVDNCEDLQELYELLYNHYVEDKDGKFRCNYSVAFLKWALKPPGWKRDWHVGVRTTPTVEGQKGKLVAFISGIPIALHVRDNRLNAIEINFLTVHHKLRNKRLTPVLIKEITRRCYLDGIYQALYTAGTLLPTPISKCRYYHRSLDWDHLYRNGFGQLPTGSTAMRQRLRYKLPRSTVLPGFRPMEKRDILAVKRLLQNYLQRFSIRQEIDVEEISHWLCSDAGKDVVWSFVVESHGKVTDLISYYVLESTILRSTGQTENIRSAYLFYYATEAAFATGCSGTPEKGQDQLTVRLCELVHDALITAKNAGFHVFNALTLMDNPLFLKDQRFEPGDGSLHYYLFNWRTSELPGGVDETNQANAYKMGGVGVVML